MAGCTWLLPTERIYQSPSFADASRAKETWLRNNLSIDYFNLTDTKRWVHLMDEFVSRTQMATDDRQRFAKFRDDRQGTTENPHNLSLRQCSDYFENFIFFYCNNDAQYSLTPTDKAHLLGDIKAVLDGGHCEVGKITRLEAILQKYRKNNDWISLELYQHRLNIVQRIADEHNAKEGVSDSSSIHTVMLMHKLAKDSKLGIEPTNEITDVHLGAVLAGSINDYFHRVSRDKFLNYEKSVSSNLTSHLMCQIIAWFRENEIDSSAWDELAITLPAEKYQRFDAYINELLNASIVTLGELDDSCENFSLLSKTGFQSAITTLLNKKLIRDGYFVNFKPHNPSLLRQHELSPQQDLTESSYVLTADGLHYYNQSLGSFEEVLILGKRPEIDDGMEQTQALFDVWELTEQKFNRLKAALDASISGNRLTQQALEQIEAITRHISPEKMSQHEIRLPLGVTLQELVLIATDLERLNTEENPVVLASKLIERHLALIKKYPLLLINVLMQQPDAWFILPKTCKNDVGLVDAYLIELTKLLLKANSQDEIERLVESLLNVVKSNPDYLNNIPSELMEKRGVVLALVAKNGLFLSQASEALRRDDAIIRHAIAQNPKAGIYVFGQDEALNQHYDELSQELPNSLRPTPFDPNTPVKIKGMMIQQVQDIFDLLNVPKMSFRQLIKLSQSVTPQKLIAIIDERQRKGLPKLPHCSRRALTQFNNAVNHDLWASQGYLAVKRQLAAGDPIISGAYLTNAYHQHKASDAITKSKQWFLAFRLYQKEIILWDEAFESWSDVLQQIKLSGRSLSLLMDPIKALLRQIVVSLKAYVIAVGVTSLVVNFMLIPAAHHLILLTSIVGVWPAAVIVGSLFWFAHILWLANRPVHVVESLMLVFSCTLFAPELLTTGVFFPVLLATNYVILFVLFEAILPLIIKLGSLISFQALSFSKIYTIIEIARINYVDSLVEWFGRLLFIGWYLSPVIDNLLIALIINVLPWLTRSWASLTTSKDISSDANEALMIEVENSIDRLLDSDEPSAQKKGNLLATLWGHVIRDVNAGNVTYRQGLNKAYPIDAENDSRSDGQVLSFWAVASTRRDSSSEFKPPAPSATPSFSFFGKPRTATTLEAYVDFGPVQSQAIAV